MTEDTGALHSARRRFAPAASEGNSVVDSNGQMVGNAKIMARGVERYFGDGKAKDRLHALGPLDLDIGDGEFVCLVGPS